MFVENLTCSGYNEEKELLLKSKTTTTSADGGCTRQKWHSNYSNLSKPWFFINVFNGATWSQ